MNDQQKISLPDIGTLFRESWALYRGRFPRLIGTTFVPLLTSFIGGLFIASGVTALAGLGIIFIIAGIVLSLISYVAVIYIFKDNLNIGRAYRVASQKFFPYLWIVILSSLITLGGYILAVIPGIIFSVWFILAPFILVVEDKRGLEAVLKSKEYIQGHWWAVLGRIIVLTVVLLAVSFALLLPASLIGKEVADIVNLVLQIILLPFAFGFGYVLYKQFTTLKPGLVTAPLATKKGFFIFSAILGLLAPIIVILIAGFTFFLGIFQLGSQVDENFNLPPPEDNSSLSQ